MKITVYITNYNYRQFLKQSIDSVLNQTYQDFELLIIDDGSTDGSRDIIETYRENPKISIIYQSNKGLNATNNVAIENARGKYIMRLDADDFLEPSALGVMVSLMEGDDELGLVFPDYYYVDEFGNRTGQERRHHFDDEVTLYDQPAHGACTMIRLAYLKKLGGYDEEFTCQDGYDLWIKFITFHKVTNISRPLFSYRRHGNNLTHNEERILSTRKRIKSKFVKRHLTPPRTLGVIPVRNTYIGDVNWPLYTYNGKSVLENKIEVCLESNHLKQLVISTADDNIIEYCQKVFKDISEVSIIKRPDNLAARKVSLDGSVFQVLQMINEKNEYDAVMTVSLDYPFINSSSLDEIIETSVIFQADSVISSTVETGSIFKHSGSSLTPILDQDKYTKYEREALFKFRGGVTFSTVSGFEGDRKMINGRIAHVLLDNKSAFGIKSKFEFDLFTSLLKR